MKSFVPDLEQELILDLGAGRINEEEFLEAFPGNPQKRAAVWLQQATVQRDPLAVELALHLGHRFGFVEESLPNLMTLVTADWHQRHEDVVSALSRLRSPQSVGSLYQAALSTYPYRHYDEFNTLGKKAIWALRRIGTLGAISRLADLARANDPILKEKAVDALNGLAKEADSEQVREAARQAIP